MQLKQPSPATKFPSSHFSRFVTFPSPHVAVHTSFVVGVPPKHKNPVSEPWQLSKQPLLSPITPPSSQSSPVTQSPSPHLGIQTVLFGACKMHVKPDSNLQVLLHPSPEIGPPS